MTQRRTPLEQALVEKVDRRARYEKAQRDAGKIKTSMWIRDDAVEAVRELVRLLDATDPDLRADLAALIERARVRS